MKVDSLFCEDYIQYMSSLSIKYNITNVKDGFFLFKVKLLICYGFFALMSRNIVYFFVKISLLIYQRNYFILCQGCIWNVSKT